MEELLVSVIIPAYKGAELLKSRSLPSIVRQTYTNWECIVIDDGSPAPDNTREIVEAFSKTDPRFRYVRKENGGPAAARNRGVRESRKEAEIVSFLDHDDEFLPDYLAKMTAALMAQSVDVATREVGAMTCGCIYIDDEGMRTYDVQTPEPYWRLAIGAGWVFRKSCFTVLDIWYDETIMNYEDVDLALRLSKLVSFATIPDALRIHYIFLNKKLFVSPKDAPASLSGYSERQVPYFELFFKKNLELYVHESPEAAAWLYYVGGQVFAQVGWMARGREMFKKSFSYRARGVTLYCLVATYGGYRFFRFADVMKTMIMRPLRARVLNKVRV